MGKAFSLKILAYLLGRVGIFQWLTQAVKRMMARKGHDLTIVYLDDFLLIFKCKSVCATYTASLEARLYDPLAQNR